MSDTPLPTIDTSMIADGPTAQTLQQFSADLQSYLIDLNSNLGLLGAAQPYLSNAQQPIVASAFSQWTNNPFKASDYVSNTGGATWTVLATDVFLNRYLVVGKLLIWSVEIALFFGSGAVTGNLAQALITLPAGLRVGPFSGGSFAVMASSNSLWVPALGQVAKGQPYVAIDRVDNSTFFTTSLGVAFTAVIEIA